MKKIILGITILIFSIITIFFLIGLFSPKEFKGSKVSLHNADSKKVWSIITNIEELPKNRPEIVKIEILERSDKNNPKVWKEYTDMGGYILFEATNWEEFKNLTLNMKESTFGMTGIWSYDLENVSPNQTKVKISEDSKIESIPVRAIMSLTGRDANLKIEEENIQKNISSN